MFICWRSLTSSRKNTHSRGLDVVFSALISCCPIFVRLQYTVSGIGIQRASPFMMPVNMKHTQVLLASISCLIHWNTHAVGRAHIPLCW